MAPLARLQVFGGVLQFVDAWSNNFAYVGRRATGTGAGDFLLVEAGWDGEVPDGTTVIRAPTGIVAIVGRLQVDGDADLEVVHALQDEFTLTPQPGAATAEGVPAPDPGVGPDLAWWERFRVALRAFPPPAGDVPFLKLCEGLGLTAPETPFADLDPEQAKVLIAGAQAGQAKIEELGKQTKATPEGWQVTTHLFDYNLDFFEVGTRDAPEWRIADRTTAAVTRAVVAHAGLWGNHGYEADYAIIWVDGDGEPLDGSRCYELRLETPPPVDAFWSLTMYDVPDFYLVANPANRYSIGDRTPGLRTAEDGSVTLYLQHESPGATKEANWLPTPRGAFRPVMRLYQPGSAVLDGSYVLPSISRVG